MAIKCGFREYEFYEMTPREFRMYVDAFAEAKKNEFERVEYQSWLTGLFVMHAVGANLSKKVKYPKNPLNNDKPITDITDMDEEEIAKVHSDVLMKLDLMAKMAFGKED